LSLFDTIIAATAAASAIGAVIVSSIQLRKQFPSGTKRRLDDMEVSVQRLTTKVDVELAAMRIDLKNAKDNTNRIADSIDRVAARIDRMRDGEH
jgi:outer membrane murein-binding lipoprotein Lpp